jgi:hypothetical protein
MGRSSREVLKGDVARAEVRRRGSAMLAAVRGATLRIYRPKRLRLKCDGSGTATALSWSNEWVDQRIACMQCRAERLLRASEAIGARLMIVDGVDDKSPASTRRVLDGRVAPHPLSG